MCHIIVELGSVRHSLVVVDLRELLDFRRWNISCQKSSFPHLCRLAGHIFSFHYLALS